MLYINIYAHVVVVVLVVVDASKYFPRFCINDNYFSASTPLAAHTKGIKQNFVPLSKH